MFPVKLHFCWVGLPTQHLSSFESFYHNWDELEKKKQSAVSHTDIKDVLKKLPADIGGFCSFLESAISTKTNNPTFYFHCYATHVPFYEKIFEDFCQKINHKYKCAPFFMPTFKVVSFEDSLKALSQDHAQLAQKFEKYLLFIQDTRLLNSKHRVNFKDAFVYCALYLYGGYAFDANFFAILHKNFLCPAQLKSIEFLQKQHQNVESIFDLRTFTTIPLYAQLEINLLIKQSHFEHWPNILPYTEESFPFMEPNDSKLILRFQQGAFLSSQKLPDSVYFPRDTTNVFWSNFNFCSTCQRSLAKNPELIDVLEFFIDELTQMTCLYHDIKISSSKQIYHSVYQYFHRCGNLAFAAPMIPKMGEYTIYDFAGIPTEPEQLKLFLPQQTAFLMQNKQKLNVCLEERLHNMAESFWLMNYSSANLYTTLNFPLIKLSDESHFVQPAYTEQANYLRECEAVKEHLV